MVVLTNKKAEIRFNKLPLLLKDMEKKEWMIDSFFFKYKSDSLIISQIYKILTICVDKSAILTYKLFVVLPRSQSDCHLMLWLINKPILS